MCRSLGRFEYGYEYLGLNGRLVITPLTEKIYLTISHALSLHLGGAIIGAGTTGKTEIIKNFATMLAVQCFVTNCTKESEFKAIATTLLGLTQCGAWGCFTNFNHLNDSIISVTSERIQTIQSALTMKFNKFMVIFIMAYYHRRTDYRLCPSAIHSFSNGRLSFGCRLTAWNLNWIGNTAFL